MRLLGSALALAALAAAQSSGQTSPSPAPAVPQANNQEPCALANGAWNESSDGKIPAKLAYDCLSSIPVAVEQDSTLIDQLKLIWQWQSDIGYYKNPPSSFELGPVDLMAELDKIKEALPNFNSEYDAQLAIQQLTTRTGNFHFNYLPDILQVFSFMRSASVSTVSDDGKSVPKTYLSSDLAVKDKDDSVDISPIAEINGENVQEYLYYAATREQYRNLDTKYNSLMHKGYSAADDNTQALGGFTLPSYAADYWGATTNFTFINGTEKSFNNIAMVSDLEGVTSAKTFFDKFCTGGMYGVNGTQSIAKGAQSLTKRQSIPNSFYPEPVIEDSNGAVAGYFMKDEAVSEVAVLKIFTFDPGDEKGEDEFQSVVKQFLHRCKEAGMKRLVIDLRENGGGSTQLLLDTFMQLFPTEMPFSIQRSRAHEAAKRIGDAWNTIYNNQEVNDKYQKLISGDVYFEPYTRFFKYDHYLDMDGETFTSWKQFYGPHAENGDLFMTPMRYNLSNSDRVAVLSGDFKFENPPAGSQAFKAEDIVMLTDGMCGSACASFHESLKNIAGVQAIVVGGAPRLGPMETIGGSKGGEVVGYADVANMTQDMHSLAKPLGLKGLEHPSIVNSAYPETVLTRAGDGGSRLQVQDQLRKDDETHTPLHFIYEAADCRIFYTRETLLHPEAMWKAAWTANTDRTKCVEGSTMQASSISGGYIPAGPEGN